jgi:hypothetical protein
MVTQIFCASRLRKRVEGGEISPKRRESSTCNVESEERSWLGIEAPADETTTHRAPRRRELMTLIALLNNSMVSFPV